MTAADILTAGRAGVEVPRQLTAGLYIAPDAGGDLCLWRLDEGGWPEYIAERSWLPTEVWAILAAVIPVRSEG